MTFMPASFHLKKRYIAYSLMILYIVICQSCMTLRFSNTETKKFFEASKTEFKDKQLFLKDIKYII